MTGRVNRVIEELATLSPPEMAEVVARFRELRSVDDNGPRVCRNGDLLRFLESHARDPEFSDDIEAGVRERRAKTEDRTSRWDL